MTDPKLQTTADLAQQLRDVIPPAPHFLAMLEELERRADERLEYSGSPEYVGISPERAGKIARDARSSKGQGDR